MMIQMKSNRLKPFALKVILSALTAVIWYATALIIEVNLIKIVLVWASIFHDMYLSIIGRLPILQSLQETVSRLSIMTSNELVVFWLIPISCFIVELIYIMKKKQSQP
ncbi:hypothetical protein OX88_21545 [Pseudomonas coronafaciens pv. porri]|nr:hypothetical protein OX88_21545 [Pseudomonas coronafaciens pv. porri]